MAHEVRVPLTEKTDWSQRMLLLADLHIDNPHSDLPLIKRTLEEARKTDARIYLFGDTFCAMQGKYDPRGSKADVRPEHQVNNYLDAIVEWTADILGPYADLIDIIGYGNHETSVLKRQESDLVQRLVARHMQHDQRVAAFVIIAAGTVTGAFSSITGLDLGDGLMFDVQQSGAAVTLEVVAAP